MGDEDLLLFCNEYLNYNPETGDFTWVKQPCNSVKINSLAGAKDHKRYLTISVKGKAYRAHRLAYLITYGYIPKYIDHINGITDDNRIVNLRECNNSENLRNRGPQKNNTSGYKGVTWIKNKNKWRCQININKSHKFLGLFNCKHEAATVYNTAARMYHGKFAYTNEVKK